MTERLSRYLNGNPKRPSNPPIRTLRCKRFGKSSATYVIMFPSHPSQKQSIICGIFRRYDETRKEAALCTPAETQLQGFINKFEPKHSALIRVVRKVLRKRMSRRKSAKKVAAVLLIQNGRRASAPCRMIEFVLSPFGKDGAVTKRQLLALGAESTKNGILTRESKVGEAENPLNSPRNQK